MTELYKRLLEAFGTDNSAEIARQLNLKRQAIYRWRDGKNDPSISALLLISKKTGASLHWLLTGQGPRLITQSMNVSLESKEKKSVEDLCAKLSERDKEALSLFLRGLQLLIDERLEKAKE